ncbi:hypothetical protein ACGF07_26060 [Kitasatospora sp. NPDC048194]|uniref:hypothetical protein n=1 Tax=Kitasatospora sp. NPDC048194 TaxID=3364045 RepID=UPI003713C33E
MHTASADASAALPSVHLTLFAAAPAGLKNPDDITRLGDLLFVPAGDSDRDDDQ